MGGRERERERERDYLTGVCFVWKPLPRMRPTKDI